MDSETAKLSEESDTDSNDENLETEVCGENPLLMDLDPSGPEEKRRRKMETWFSKVGLTLSDFALYFRNLLNTNNVFLAFLRRFGR